MKMLTTPYLLALGLIGAALLYVSARGATKTGEKIGAAAVDLAEGVLGGAVVGIGQKVGIPATSESECDRAIAEGRTWDASFSCPAGRFLKYVTGR